MIGGMGEADGLRQREAPRRKDQMAAAQRSQPQRSARLPAQMVRPGARRVDDDGGARLGCTPIVGIAQLCAHYSPVTIA